jgi:hypothetical protein
LYGFSIVARPSNSGASLFLIILTVRAGFLFRVEFLLASKLLEQQPFHHLHF